MSDPRPSPTFTRAQARSRWLAGGCALLAVVLPLSAAVALNMPGAGLAHVGSAANPTPAAWQTAAALLFALLPVTALAYGLLRMRRCLLGFACGATFSLGTVRELRAFAGAAVLSALLGLVVPTVIGAIVQWGSPSTRHAMVLHVSSSDLVLALVAGILWQVASVFTQAIEIAEENAQII